MAKQGWRKIKDEKDPLGPLAHDFTQKHLPLHAPDTFTATCSFSRHIFSTSGMLCLKLTLSFNDRKTRRNAHQFLKASHKVKAKPSLSSLLAPRYLSRRLFCGHPGCSMGAEQSCGNSPPRIQKSHSLLDCRHHDTRYKIPFFSVNARQSGLFLLMQEACVALRSPWGCQCPCQILPLTRLPQGCRLQVGSMSGVHLSGGGWGKETHLVEGTIASHRAQSIPGLGSLQAANDF